MPAIRAVFVLVGAALGVFYPFISAILDDRGFSAEAIGLTTAFAALGFAISVPIWGHLGDVVIGRVAALRIAIAGSTVAAVALLLDVPPVGVAMLIIVYAGFESAVSPIADALAVNAISGARAYARIRLLMSVGFAGASILAGRLYDVAGFDPASLLWAAAAAAILVASRWVPDVGRYRAPARAAGARRGGSFALVLRTQPRIRGLLLGLGLVHVGVLAGFTFLALRILELGGQASDVALSAGVSALAEIPAMALIPRVAARTGMRALLVGGILLYGLVMASWAFLADPGLIVATRVVSGVAFSALTIAAVLTIASLLPPELQGTGQGLYQTVGFGVAAVVANAIGGLVYGSGGAMPLFLGCAALAVLGAIVAWRSVPAPARPDAARPGASPTHRLPDG